MFHRLPVRFNKIDDALEGALQTNFNDVIAKAKDYAKIYDQEYYVVFDDDYNRFLTVSADFLEWREAVYYVAYPD